MKSVFEVKNHFEYISEQLEARRNVRGIKTQFSEFLRIKPAFLSQVLSEKYSLSLEQADLANQFFDHSAEEADFFILMVSRDRAGSVSLKKHYDQQINQILKKRLLVIERLGRKGDLSEETKGTYYSSWLYAAIHILTTIPEYRTRKALAEKTRMSMEALDKALQFLMTHNLIHKEGDHYLPTHSWIRVDKESPHIVKHHSNWRLQAINNLEKQTDQDLHYSGVFSMDVKTALHFKDKFLELLKAESKKIEASKEEELFIINMDLFNLK